MEKLKSIALGAAVLGAIGCEPVPYQPPYYDSFGRPIRQPDQNFGNQGQRARGDQATFRTQGDQGNSGNQNQRNQPSTQGRQFDNRYGQPQQNNPRIDPTPPTVETAPPRSAYPTAESTSNPDQVLSPYAPYNVIDVEGFRTGQLAKDPSNGKIFRVP